ncbi:hypothetical protein BGX24_009629 [Mortierella sp. AD032]|nr:hypothetical protein BGX24_009629 [Mortierella sp. AD032]
MEIYTHRKLENLMALSAEFTKSIRSSKIPTTSLTLEFQFNNAKAHLPLDRHINKTWNLDMESPAIDAILISIYLNPAILQLKVLDEPNGYSSNRTRAECLITRKKIEIMVKNKSNGID